LLDSGLVTGHHSGVSSSAEGRPAPEATLSSQWRRWWQHLQDTSYPPDGSSRAQRLRASLFRVRELAGWRAWVPISLLAIAYASWFTWESMRMFAAYAYPPFDLAINDQGLWLLSHFHSPFVTVMGRNLFGDHPSFILLLLVPIYRLFPEPQGILVIQSMVLAVTALPIFAVARRLTGSVAIATTIGAVYLLNPALQQENLEQFHPECLQVLVFALAVYAAVESRAWLLGVTVVLTLLTKEDAAILVVPLGVWVAARRNWRWGLAIVLAGVGYASVVNEMVVPALLGGPSLYTGRIPFGGVSGFFTTLVRQPGQIWSYVRSDGRPFYLWQMGFSMGWAFVVAPELALVVVLVLLENILSLDPYMHQILYHYSMRAVPTLAIGVAWAISRQRRRSWRIALTTSTLICALWSCVLWGLAPFSNHPEPISPTAAAQINPAMTYLERDLPPTASVSALDYYVSHLDHRTHIYVWPAPFIPANWGLPGTATATLPPPASVTYLLLPQHLSVDQNSSIFDHIKSEYRVLRQRDGLVLYIRDQ